MFDFPYKERLYGVCMAGDGADNLGRENSFDM
jgi:hypothetical protein